MGSDCFYKRRVADRKKRKEDVINQKSSKWLVVCEGTKTEKNYFEKAVADFNKKMPTGYKLNVKVVGKGMNTTSLVKAADMQIELDKLTSSIIPYGKIFVVFDKDSFDDENFNKAIKMCENNGYIPLWSNQAIEFWFLLHFHYICTKINRTDYAEKLNSYFKDKGLNYKYKKNDEEIYGLLCQYGSLENARKRSKKIYDEHKVHLPSESESCTTIHLFFDEIDERIKELQ